MTHNGFPHGEPLTTEAADAGARVVEVVRHVTLALSRHARQLQLEGVPVPREVEELCAFLVHLARARHAPPEVADEFGTDHYPGTDRMLVTKREAAYRLGVSIRTVERLVAAGRLQQVRVERLARFRIDDLEAYVHGLAEAGT